MYHLQQHKDRAWTPIRAAIARASKKLLSSGNLPVGHCVTPRCENKTTVIIPLHDRTCCTSDQHSFSRPSNCERTTSSCHCSEICCDSHATDAPGQQTLLQLSTESKYTECDVRTARPTMHRVTGNRPNVAQALAPWEREPNRHSSATQALKGSSAVKPQAPKHVSSYSSPMQLCWTSSMDSGVLQRTVRRPRAARDVAPELRTAAKRPRI